MATGKAIDLTTPLDALIDFKLFTWGKFNYFSSILKSYKVAPVSLNKFLNASFGGIIFTKIA